MQSSFAISKFQLKSGLQYLIVSSSPLRSIEVNYEVHSVIRAILVCTSIQQNLYMQNSAHTFYTYTEIHQHRHIEQN